MLDKSFAFTQQYTGTTNRIITEIQLSLPFDPALPPDPKPPLIKSLALWDTGATGTIISSEVVNQLGCIQTGTSLVTHGGGAGNRHPTHVLNMILPNNLMMCGVPAVELPTLPQGDFGVIIGMDTISRGDLSITHLDGKTCVSFRIPSSARIDYVEESNRMKPRVGRNDPCPCGSGTKFKKCHGSPASMAESR